MDDLQQSDPYMPEYSGAEFAKKAELREERKKIFYEDGFDTLMITEILTECRWQNANLLEREIKSFS
jgi:hypothetical protein